MIEAFADQGTRDIFEGTDSKAARRQLPKQLWGVARRKLDLLNRAVSMEDLKVPPANRLEKLSGELAGKLSIRINEQYRVVFRFEAGKASEVWVGDYHD